MGNKLAASLMWSMKCEHSTNRKYTISCFKFMVLCKVIRRRPTARGKFLYNIRAPAKIQRIKKNYQFATTPNSSVVQMSFILLLLISKEKAKVHLARWHLFRFVASLTCIYHCTIKTCQPFVQESTSQKRWMKKMHFLILQKTNFSPLVYNFQKWNLIVRNKSYLLKKVDLLGKNQSLFSKWAIRFESKKGFVTTLRYIAF